MLFQGLGGNYTEKRVHRNKNERNRSPDEAWGRKEKKLEKNEFCRSLGKFCQGLGEKHVFNAQFGYLAKFWARKEAWKVGSAEASENFAKALADGMFQLLFSLLSQISGKGRSLEKQVLQRPR